MANPYFKFKQFSIHQDRCAMKVGTDGVLLGAWAGVEKAERILDIGAGTGLVSLMLAQRSRAKVFAVELDEPAFVQMRENVESSPWKERVEAIHSDIKQYAPGMTFDVIVSNPPYFRDSLVSPDGQRTLARHSGSLTYYDLPEVVFPLLSAAGEFSVIIPFEASGELMERAKNFGMYPSRQLNVITSPGKVPKRSLIAFTFREEACEVQELLIEKERHLYSDEYIALTKDFYLNM